MGRSLQAASACGHLSPDPRGASPADLPVEQSTGSSGVNLKTAALGITIPDLLFWRTR
jgi:hypothetical protein